MTSDALATNSSSVSIAGITITIIEGSFGDKAIVDEQLRDEKAERVVKFIAERAWPAGFVLAEYFVWRFRNLPLSFNDNTHFRMLELGAGTGITSAFLGKVLQEASCEIPHVDIFVSDLGMALPLISRNIQANVGSRATDQVQLHSIALDWTDLRGTKEIMRGMRNDCTVLSLTQESNLAKVSSPTEAKKPAFDLIYASDVVYFPHLFEPLIQTLVVLSESESRTSNSPTLCPEIILCCRLRELSKELPFYARLGKYFFLVLLEDHEWDDGAFWKRYRGEFVLFRCIVREIPLEADGSDEFEAIMQSWMDTDLFQ